MKKAKDKKIDEFESDTNDEDDIIEEEEIEEEAEVGDEQEIMVMIMKMKEEQFILKRKEKTYSQAQSS